jgi:hypothetical protein
MTLMNWNGHDTVPRNAFRSLTRAFL